jgi:hypothetical protein
LTFARAQAGRAERQILVVPSGEVILELDDGAEKATPCAIRAATRTAAVGAARHTALVATKAPSPVADSKHGP